MVAREEHACEIHGALADLPPDGVRDVTSRCFRIGISRERRCKLEGAAVCAVQGMRDHRTGITGQSDARIQAFRSILGKLLVVPPHIGIVVVELSQQIM